VTNLQARLAYWLPTGLVVLNFAFGGASTLLGAESSREVFQRLGYPAYFGPMLAVAQLLGAAALVIPVPRTLREWAYAGLSFDAIAAAVSLLAVGLPVYHLGFPVVILALTLTSHWAWRRRLAPAKHSGAFTK
jgi:hypothetical protein